MNRLLKRFIAGTLSLAILASPFFVLANLQNIKDWLLLRNYTPPAAVSLLASQDTMTPKATHVFYVNHPQIVEGVTSFRQQCKIAEQTIVLGCYHAGQEGIAIYNVQDARLNGVVQVTASHEMLHAAYERLSGSEKTNVDNMLQDYYKNGLKDQRILDTIDSYKKTEPNDVINEMHSVFGTEVANLPAPLETYYQKYFSNRKVVTGFASVYQSEFASRKNRIDAYDEKLALLKQQIETKEHNLQIRSVNLKSEQQRLDSLRSSGRTEEYNASVPDFNQLVNEYNAGVSDLQTDITNYNNLVTERNALAKDLEGLQEALDTRLSPQSTQ